MVHRNEQHKIQTTIFRKPSNQQTYLHAQSNHPKSLKDSSIPYSPALRIKTICSTTKTVRSLQKGLRRGYPENLVNEQVDKVKNMKRKQLLLTNKKLYRIAFQCRQLTLDICQIYRRRRLQLY